MYSERSVGVSLQNEKNKIRHKVEGIYLLRSLLPVSDTENETNNTGVILYFTGQTK